MGATMMLPRCREVSRMIADGTFEDGPFWLRFLAQLHLLLCRYCQRYLMQVRLMGDAMRRVAIKAVDAERAKALEERLLREWRGGPA